MTATEAPALTARERATRLLALKVARDWIDKEDRRLREKLLREAVTGERLPGVLDPEDPDETLLGFVQKKAGAKSIHVTDRPALIEWCREHAPDELVTVTTTDVRSSFVAALSAAVKADGGWVHPETSELLKVPGVELVQGSPTLAVTATAEADGLVADALAARSLRLMPGTTA